MKWDVIITLLLSFGMIFGSMASTEIFAGPDRANHETNHGAQLWEPDEIEVSYATKELELMTGGQSKVARGWKFAFIKVNISGGTHKNVQIELDKILIHGSNNEDYRCAAYSISESTHFPCVYNRSSKGSFDITLKTFWMKKLEWKDNVVRLIGVRDTNSGLFRLVFAVPQDYKVKIIDWYGKKIVVSSK